jgi:uncharacterized membrane protein YhaH (DUF805 family)
MNFGQAITAGFRGYVDFAGAASRPAFWFWTLFTFLVGATLEIVSRGTGDGLFVLGNLWALAILLPNLAILVRRFRDSGRPWSHIFFSLIPVVGPILLIVWACAPSLVIPDDGTQGQKIQSYSPPAPTE